MNITAYHYALFVLNREKQLLENKIEEIKDGFIYTSERRRKLAILMHEEELKSLKRAMEQLERATR